MLGIIAAVLIVCWLLGLFAFHVSTGLVHILLVVGLILLVLHFVRGRSAPHKSGYCIQDSTISPLSVIWRTVSRRG